VLTNGHGALNDGGTANRHRENPEGTMRVCLVEDDGDLRDALAEVLQRAGFEARTAKNGLQAIQILRDWQPDIVVCDMIMPDCEGFEVLRNAQSIVPDARFVMISGVTGEILDVLEAARLLGADAILRKPFTPSELLDTLTEVTEGSGGSAEGSTAKT
jgi:two-component system chemotaxis response regulator CheY